MISHESKILLPFKDEEEVENHYDSTFIRKSIMEKDTRNSSLDINSNNRYSTQMNNTF